MPISIVNRLWSSSSKVYSSWLYFKLVILVSWKNLLLKACVWDCVCCVPATFRSSASCEHGNERDRGDRKRDRFERFYRCKGRQGCDDRNSQNQNSKRSLTRGSQELDGGGQDILDSVEPVDHVGRMTKDQDRASIDIGSGDRGPRTDLIGKNLILAIFMYVM